MPIPPLIKAGIDHYVRQRIPPGGFLRAVLENNLSEAFARADATSTANMKDIVVYIYNTIPSVSWGSPQRVADWLSGETQRQYGYKLTEEDGDDTKG